MIEGRTSLSAHSIILKVIQKILIEDGLLQSDSLPTESLFISLIQSLTKDQLRRIREAFPEHINEVLLAAARIGQQDFHTNIFELMKSSDKRT